MIEISQDIFEIVYSGFNNLLSEKIDDEKIDLKNHPVIVEQENYKYKIIDDAKNQLKLKIWKESDIGSGTILRNVQNSINVKSNNLIDWRKKDDFKKLKANRDNEQFLFDFFKSKINDEVAFNNFKKIGFSYQLIAYLFFIKNHQKYMPISQEKFDEIFNTLNIDFKTSNNCSWENYLEFIEIIKQFKKQLSQRYKTVSLLDSHSFLWIYGSQLNKLMANAVKQENTSKKEKLISKSELETYNPKKIAVLENLLEEKNEFDYIENHRKLMEIGDLAEKIVFRSEIDFLQTDYPELAKNVRLVSSNPKLGFDILSFETDGRQKQIEVKAVSVNDNNKSFIITRNEFLKSKTYSNYYIYCVTNINTDKPKILRIKNPDFNDNDVFFIEPLTYKITFE